MCERALAGEGLDFVERWPDETEAGSTALGLRCRRRGTDLLGGLMFDVTAEHMAEQELRRHAERLAGR